MKAKWKTFLKTWKSTSFMFGYVWKYGKSYVFGKVVYAVLAALLNLPGILLPGLIINELTGTRDYRILLAEVLLLLFVPFFGGFIKSILGNEIAKLGRRVGLQIRLQYFDRLNDIRLERFDDPDFWDVTDHNYDLVYDITNVVDQISELFTNILSILAITSIILTLSPVTVIIALFCIWLNSLVTRRINIKQYKAEKEMVTYERVIDGTTKPFNPGYIKEIRMFHLKDYLIQRYQKAKRDENAVRIRLEKQQGNAGILIALTDAAYQVYLYGYLIWRVLFTGLPVGSMTIYMNAANQFSSALTGVVNAYLSLANNELVVDDVKVFQDTPTAIEESGNLIPRFDQDSVIEFRNVSFRYPGSDGWALKNINLTLRGTEKLCVVGENGAGKTTFLKLLTRFYRPTEGEICFNGVNVEEFDYNAWLSCFSAVWQEIDFFPSSTLGENIVLNLPYDSEKLHEIGRQSDIDELVKKLPKGYDTPMFKRNSDDGIEPSGGETQKIAIARACYHGGDIFILDEPTAALDPLAENRMFGQFESMIRDKPAVLITHRLSAVKLADRVAVFQNGAVIEYGTHEEVYRMGGVYAEMYDKQAEFYVSNEAREI